MLGQIKSGTKKLHDLNHRKKTHKKAVNKGTKASVTVKRIFCPFL